MKTAKLSEESAMEFAEELGMVFGSILPTLFQSPPTSPEAAEKTVHALKLCLVSAMADGAPDYIGIFLAGIITSIENYALQGDDPEFDLID